jgi:hypothetical protein
MFLYLIFVRTTYIIKFSIYLCSKFFCLLGLSFASLIRISESLMYLQLLPERLHRPTMAPISLHKLQINKYGRHRIESSTCTSRGTSESISRKVLEFFRCPDLSASSKQEPTKSVSALSRSHFVSSRSS